MVASRFCWLTCLLALIGAPVGSLASDPPNIVLIIGDDISYRDYGFMGAKHVDTPSLDKLAREGLTYTRGYVPTSLCRASLMSIVTGLYPHQHGVVGNDPPKGEDRTKMLWAIRKHETILKLLSKQGYYSFQTGKWWEGAATDGGFTAGVTHGDPSKGGRHGDEGLKIGRENMAPIENAIVVAKQEKKSFFIWYAPMLPHTPHDPPADLLTKYQPKSDSIHQARYWANIERFDRTIGDLRKLLAVQEVEHETLIVYLHDNGWIQDLNQGKFAPRSKRTPYEGGIRTPIILHWPGKILPRRDESLLVSSIDVLPTIVSASRGTVSSGAPGMSLLPEDAMLRDTAFGEGYSHDIASLASPAEGLEHRWCIHNSFKLIVNQKSRERELYDLANDPLESKNLAESRYDLTEQLMKKLDEHWNGKAVAVEIESQEAKGKNKP